MHPTAYENAKLFYEKHCKGNVKGKDVLDVGSLNVAGNTLKSIFAKGNYIGLDQNEGANVDVVSSSHEMPFKTSSFDIIVSTSCFEHDDMFWLTFSEMCRVLRTGGLIYICAPSSGQYHGFPGDNWRFYKDSWKSLEKWGKRGGYNINLIETYIDTAGHWKDSIGIYKKGD